ncbi:MAG TPA: VOC family protein [Myxococcota bacterium]|nr:VOC family protein [Myxococcales bacterium]HPG24578.1 VOC family protein [Myxococcota bacterium]
MTVKANGVHHIAFSTADMKTQLEFFTDVLGMPLVGLFPMHGVPGGLHAFLEASPDCSISFVQLPAMAGIEVEFGRTHAGNATQPTAPGTLQHLALHVDDDEALIAIRNRIRSRGVNVLGPIDHGLCRSIYFAGPEGLTLEIATSDQAIDPRAWIDPETVAAIGVDEEGLARLVEPDAYESPAVPVPQPPLDPSRPHLRYPKPVYEKLLQMSDEELSKAISYPEPPVRPRDRA